MVTERVVEMIYTWSNMLYALVSPTSLKLIELKEGRKIINHKRIIQSVFSTCTIDDQIAYNNIRLRGCSVLHTFLHGIGTRKNKKKKKYGLKKGNTFSRARF